MHRAIALSRNGFPAPNPHVGCVIVRDGEIVGEGWHPYAGGPHAEVMALEAAGEKAKGSHVFVTLEPCNHTGRTGPCSEALIKAGVQRVYIACQEPNPEAFGGIQRLQQAGVDVVVDLLSDEARQANSIWMASMRQLRPFVAVKAAITLDGKIALPSGESKWITSEQARTQGQLLRAEMGAVLVGSGTVIADDPQLTVRAQEVRNQPIRIVLDPFQTLQGTERVFQEPGGETLWLVAEGKHSGNQIPIPLQDGLFEPTAILSLLWKRGLTSVLVEGGGKTIASFLKAGVVDRLDVFLAPKVFGDGVPWVNGQLSANLSELQAWQFEPPVVLGEDVWLRANPKASP